MKTMLKEISKGKNLEINLPKYATNLMSLYNRFANVRLCMNYFNYYEVITESDSKSHAVMKEILEKLNQIIGTVLIPENTGAELEKSEVSIDKMRNEIIRSMQILTSYTDIFNIYEYVLNRMEHRFDGKDLPESYSDEEITRHIMQYILHDKDHTVINSKISEIIGQLPVRMTKGRFFDYAFAGIALYKGGQKSSLDDFLYMIRTSALLTIPEGMEQYEELYSIYQELEKTKFGAIDEQEYKALHDKILYASAFLENIVDRYVMITELLNDTYAILLSMPYAIKDASEAETCTQILAAVNGKFLSDCLDPLGEEVTDMLICLEGKQEKLSEEYLSCEYLLADIKDQYQKLLDSMMLAKQYSCLDRISVLLSGSIFVELDKRDDDEVADEAYVTQCQNQFAEDLKAFFATHEKQVNRAVMASILAGLPVFFENISELQDYVFDALKACGDKNEKLAVAEIVDQIVSEGM